MNKMVLALLMAASNNCPLVDVAGTYTLDLRTETATVWNEINANQGCSSKGHVSIGQDYRTNNVNIQADGIMTAGNLYWWGNGNYNYSDGQFGGRVKPGPEPMQWVGSAGNTELKGTWERGQLSGEFIRRFTYEGKRIECRGTISGFKKSK
jgi:hypothetical protein